MTLINWEAHRAKFLELREETGDHHKRILRVA